MEILLVGLAILLWIVLLFVFIGGPVLGILAYWQLRDIRRRLVALEERTFPDAEEAAEAVPEAESVATRGRIRQAEPAQLPPTPQQPEPEPAAPEDAEPGSRLEGVLGGKVLGWAAVVLLMLAFGYFLQHAFANDWIGPFGQVSMGIIGGTVLCVAGQRLHWRGRVLFAQMLLAAGVAVLYLSVFAGFGYYKLLPLERGGVYLSLIVAFTVGLAIFYRARGIAILALAGGLISPMLLQTEHDAYHRFFLYLLVLDVGMLFMALMRGWLWLAPLSLVGVQWLFWMWVHGNYHPEKLAGVLWFQTAIFLLHLGFDVVVPFLKRERARPTRLVDVVINSIFFAVAGTAFLSDNYHPVLPILAVAVALVHGLHSRLLQMRQPGDPPLQLTLVSLSFGFLAAAFALRLSSGWIGVAWSVMGLGLWWYGLRVQSLAMRCLAVVLLVGASLQVLFGGLWVPGAVVSAPAQYDIEDPLSRGFFRRDLPLYIPLLNRFAFPGLVVMACLLTAAYLTRVRRGNVRGIERVVWLACVLAGIGLGWMILSTDVYRFVRTLEIQLDWTSQDSFSVAMASVSVAWALYAGLVLAIGFRRDSRTIRYVGLGLFALAMLKVLVVDSTGLEGIYRVPAFFALAVVMGAGAWTYQCLEEAHRRVARENRS